MLEIAFISLGSNIEPERYLALAVKGLHALGEIRSVSMVYQNPSIGPTPQPDFLNAAVAVATGFPAGEIRACLRALEAELDRVRTQDKFAARTIDLDLCLLGDRILREPELVVPDPDLLTRAHLIVPIAELDPDFLHPETGERLQTIANRLRNSAELTPRPDVAQRLRLELNNPPGHSQSGDPSQEGQH